MFSFIVIAAETNEEGHTADGPQRPIPSIRLPPVRSRKTEMTKDGESVAQFADMVIAQATWSGKALDCRAFDFYDKSFNLHQ